jgi:uncharacterized protein YbjT (DUF2867 family)
MGLPSSLGVLAAWVKGLAIAIKSRSLSAAIFVPIDRWDRNQPNGEDAMNERNQPILIIGGTGKTGRRVAEKLAARGVAPRIASRSGAIRFDWDDSSTWGAALDGVGAAYVTYSPDLAVPEAPPAIEKLARLAAEGGVRRLVLLSGRGEEEAQRCERIVLDANPEWTVVRASWFNQNFSEGFFLDPLRDGVLALPAGDVREPFVDTEDIADVAVAALTEAGHEGRIYEVTGPRLMTFAEAVEEIGRAAGRELPGDPAARLSGAPDDQDGLAVLGHRVLPVRLISIPSIDEYEDSGGQRTRLDRDRQSFYPSRQRRCLVWGG